MSKAMTEREIELRTRIRENLLSVHERMGEAARRAGRSPEDVRLVAVTKYAEDPDVLALYAAGHREFAENRVLEALPRIERVPPDCRWHMIGHVQRNKANKVPGTFCMVQSLDSIRLMQKLAEAAGRLLTGERLPGLLEFNMAREPQKHGFLPEEAESALLAAQELRESLDVRGLMCMAPYSDDPEDSRQHFAALRKLRDSLASDDLPLRELSMGMSGDFEVGVEEGATIIRVGSALFA